VRVAGYIQATEQRWRLADKLSRALSASDLDHHELCMQPAGTNPWQSFFDVLEAMAASDADLVIRFEEDAIVNPFLKHNLVRWKAIGRPRFAQGWLYSPPTTVRDIIYRRRLDNPHRKPKLCGCVAVVFRRLDLIAVLPALRAWATDHPQGFAYDFCLSHVAFQERRELWLHDPPIVEHDRRQPSAFGHVIDQNCCTRDAYQPRFRRYGNPVILPPDYLRPAA